MNFFNVSCSSQSRGAAEGGGFLNFIDPDDLLRTPRWLLILAPPDLAAKFLYIQSLARKHHFCVSCSHAGILLIVSVQPLLWPHEHPLNHGVTLPSGKGNMESIIPLWGPMYGGRKPFPRTVHLADSPCGGWTTVSTDAGGTRACEQRKWTCELSLHGNPSVVSKLDSYRTGAELGRAAPRP